MVLNECSAFQTRLPGGVVAGELAIEVLLAFAVLAVYAVACFVFPVIATRRRDIL
jgi:hypothetical protein